MFESLKIVPMVTCLVVFTACATQTRTVTTESTYDPAPVSSTAQATTRTTTETYTETPEESGGILSSTVDVVGKTIALPFRAVGGLIDLIF